MGRPSIYSAELAASICERIALGESLRAICRDEGMPATSTVFEWLSQDSAFADQYARAREAQADALADELLEIADDGTNDWMERHGKEDAGWVANGENLNRSRLRVDTRKWIASKLKPKKYGERQAIDLDARVEQYVVRAPEPAKDASEWLKSSSGLHSLDLKPTS